MSSLNPLTTRIDVGNIPSPSEMLAAGSMTPKEPENGEKQTKTATAAENDAAASNQAPTDSEEVVVVNPEAHKNAKKRNLIEHATLQHCKIPGNGELFPIKKVRAGKDVPSNQSSSLESIAGVKVKDIDLDHLRGFCSLNDIGGMRTAKKKVCCDAIVEACLNPSDPNKENDPGKKERLKPVNRLRYANVIFGEIILPLLATRGETCTKDELTEGIKTDETLHRKIAMEYNNEEKYNDFEHSHLRQVPGNPAVYQGTILWIQSMKALKLYIKDYEVSFNNWKKSGNHEGLLEINDGKVIPFENFIKSKHDLLYLHEYVYRHPNVFAKVTGTLPVGAFSESIVSDTQQENMTGSAIVTAKTRKRNRSTAPGKQKTTDSDLSKYFEKKEKTNRAMEKSCHVDSTKKMMDTLDKRRDRKRSLITLAATKAQGNPKKGEDWDEKKIRQRVKDYKILVDALEDSDNESNLGFSSQESIYKEILGIEEDLKWGETEKKSLKAAVSAFNENENNEDKAGKDNAK